jgi:hypothetical protein
VCNELNERLKRASKISKLSSCFKNGREILVISKSNASRLKGRPITNVSQHQETFGAVGTKLTSYFSEKRGGEGVMAGRVDGGFNECETIDASMGFVIKKKAKCEKWDYSPLRGEAGVML